MYKIYQQPGYDVTPVYCEDGELEEGDLLFAYSDVDIIGFNIAPINPGLQPPTDFIIDIIDEDGFHLFCVFCCGDETGCHYEIIECYETGGTSEPYDEVEW